MYESLYRLSICIYAYIYIYLHVYIHIYLYNKTKSRGCRLEREQCKVSGRVWKEKRKGRDIVIIANLKMIKQKLYNYYFP